MIKVSYLKRILNEIMYKEQAVIKRSEVMIDDETGESEYQLLTIYDQIPCKLSQYKELAGHRDDRAGIITLDLRLTCDPEYRIEEGDIVEIYHCGEFQRLIAGTSFNYPTHKEISLRRRRENEQG